MVLTLGAATIIVDQAWWSALVATAAIVGIVAGALAAKDWWTANRKGRPRP